MPITVALVSSLCQTVSNPLIQEGLGTQHYPLDGMTFRSSSDDDDYSNENIIQGCH